MDNNRYIICHSVVGQGQSKQILDCSRGSGTIDNSGVSSIWLLLGNQVGLYYGFTKV